MVGISILGIGVGFLIPTLTVHENSLGEIARQEIQNLYLGYFVFSAICLLLHYFLMRSQPASAPSDGAVAQKVGSTL